MVLNVKAGRSGLLISGYTLCFCPHKNLSHKAKFSTDMPIGTLVVTSKKV